MNFAGEVIIVGMSLMKWLSRLDKMRESFSVIHECAPTIGLPEGGLLWILGKI